MCGSADIGPPRFKELTTLRIGGTPKRFLKCDSETEMVESVMDADQSGHPLLVLGGGSNLVVSDEPYPGTVVCDARQNISVTDVADGGVKLFVAGGTRWDHLVEYAAENCWSGLEALSGIPGSVGAAPVQNIGAYGHQVGESLVSIRALDRATQQIVTLSKTFLKLGYRNSTLKRSVTDQSVGGGKLWGPTGRWVVLGVELLLSLSERSTPILYGELAKTLGVPLGGYAPGREVRQAVIELRRSKGMILDSLDHDTWSVGSFFTNPVIGEEKAKRFLPDDAPKFGEETGGVVKTSAAWLISASGFERGYKMSPKSHASLSTKHVLAITNRGNATSKEIADLATHVKETVASKFGIELEVEPSVVGMSI